MEKLVLLIDDNRLPMDYYVKALRQEGFKVQHCLGTDAALNFVETEGSEIAVIVLDIMLPPGKTYKDEDTNEGLRTGVFLLEDIRKYCPKKPVVVLTNVTNPSTLNEFENLPLVRIVQKKDCPPFELAELVGAMSSGVDKEIADDEMGKKIEGENSGGNADGS